MNYCFGLISEGPSDQWVIRSILSGYFNTSDPSTTPLQPNVDATSGKFDDGNWDKVIKYIKSENFIRAFENVQFVIIHVDTDWVDTKEHPYEIQYDNKDTSQMRVENMKLFLIREMSEEIHAKFQDRIIWSIADRQTECWMLPLFATTKSDKVKTINCLNTLNQYLQPKFNFTINKKEKAYYEKASKDFRNRKLFDRAENFQGSMSSFLDNLETSLPGRMICKEQDTSADNINEVAT